MSPVIYKNAGQRRVRESFDYLRGDEDQLDDSNEDVYFNPIQPVKSADEDLHYKLPASWAERLFQTFHETTTDPTDSHLGTESNFSAMSVSAIIILIVMVLFCCILPCIYYLFYDPELCKGLRKVFNDTRIRTLERFGPRSAPYTSFYNDGEESSRRKHPRNSRRKSRHSQRRIEIPIPSNESVDIYITTTDDESPAGMHHHHLYSDELDVVDVSDKDYDAKSRGNKNTSHVVKNKRPCPFEPVNHTHHHQGHQEREAKVTRHAQVKYEDTVSLSSDEEQEIYTRYNDPNKYHIHDEMDSMDKARETGETTGNDTALEDRVHKSILADLDFKKSKVYDDLINQWKWSNVNTNTIANLGEKPPPRRSKNGAPR